MPGGSITLTSSITSGGSFQWQVNSGNGFVNISANANYSGTATASLQLNNIPSAWVSYQYRCLVDGTASDAYALQFYNGWTGAVSRAWENAANWSCGSVPDSNTDVMISQGSVQISSNVTVRSLAVKQGVTLTIASGYKLSILR